MTKTLPTDKKCKKAKWLSEEALHIAEEIREANGKGERKRDSQLNADFQRRARRDKKALNKKWKEIKENNRMRKTRDLYQGTFHARMVTIKDRNRQGLTEAEEMKKRREDYTEELLEKLLVTGITMMVWSLT